MKTRHVLFLAAGLTAALAATVAVSAPRQALREAFAPPGATELGLSGAHAQQWERLRDDTMALRQVGREDMRDGLGELRSLLDQSSPDLRAFSRESQRKLDAHLAEARALRERQLDLYESLTPAEQARVRQAMAKRLDRLSQLRARLVEVFGAQS